MKSRKIFRTLWLMLAGFAILQSLVSCNKELDLGLKGTDCSVLSFKLKSGEDVLIAGVFSESIILTADYDRDLTSMTVEVVLSEGASMFPDPASISDWSSDMEFKVTSADGAVEKTYSYIVKREAVESYCQEDIYLRTQDEVSEFGSHNYRRVRSIVICDSEDSQITDLSPLNSLEIVDKNLTVKGFHGKEVRFDNLISVSTLDVLSASIESVMADKLTEVNNLYIGYISEEQTSGSIDSLAVTSFPSVRKIKGNFILNFFNQNTDFSISGFDNLESVDGDIVFSFSTKNYKTFSRLSKVNNIQVGGRVGSFEGLENLKEITGVFSTNFLSGVESMLPFCPEKVGIISLQSCQEFNNLDFCQNLTELSAFEIRGAYKLASLKGLENLRRIDNGLYISYTSLVNLNELSDLEHVGGIIYLNYNTKLEDFSGLRNCLENFDGDWILKGNKQNPTIDEVLGK